MKGMDPGSGRPIRQPPSAPPRLRVSLSSTRCPAPAEDSWHGSDRAFGRDKEARMVKPRMGLRVAAGCLLVWGGVAPAWAASVADVLQFRPKQPGIAYSTPTPQEEAGCKLDWVPAKTGKGGTYVL